MKNSIRHPRSEKGAVLVISLLLLTIMSILAITMSQTSTLEERMAGNARDVNMAFQASDAGLNGGARRTDTSQNAKLGLTQSEDCTDILCCVSTPQGNYAGVDFSQQDDTWWKANGVEYGTAGKKDLDELAGDPQYVITRRGKVRDTLTVGSTKNSETYFYEVTSRAVGKSGTTSKINQGIYAARL